MTAPGRLQFLADGLPPWLNSYSSAIRMAAQLNGLFELRPLYCTGVNLHFLQAEAYSFQFWCKKGLYICQK